MSDNTLDGNEKIEEAAKLLAKEPSDELLAHTLTLIRNRMKEGGVFIIGVEAPDGSGQAKLSCIETADGKKWWVAFTSMDQQLAGKSKVMSTFQTDIKQLLERAIRVPEIDGVIINPWDKTLRLSKPLISITLGIPGTV
ncbi:MAG TPA: hypothetical protein DCP07_03640 [Lachnospiraceae bacterium]|nr:hypothetical protein [Lachnospiraceae bacterium]